MATQPPRSPRQVDQRAPGGRGARQGAARESRGACRRTPKLGRQPQRHLCRGPLAADLRRDARRGRSPQGDRQPVRIALERRRRTARSSMSRHCPSSIRSRHGGITILRLERRGTGRARPRAVRAADVHRDGPAQAHRPAAHRRARVHPVEDERDGGRHPPPHRRAARHACRAARCSTGSTRSRSS